MNADSNKRYVIRDKQLKLLRPPKAALAPRELPKLPDSKASTSRTLFRDTRLQPQKATGSNWISLDIGDSEDTLLRPSRCNDRAHRSFDDREPLEATKPRVFGPNDFHVRVFSEEICATRPKPQGQRQAFEPADHPQQERSALSSEASVLPEQPRFNVSSRREISSRFGALRPQLDVAALALAPRVRLSRVQHGYPDSRPNSSHLRSVEQQPGLDRRLAEQLDRSERLREEGRRVRGLLRLKQDLLLENVALAVNRPAEGPPRGSLRTGEPSDFSAQIKELRSQLRVLGPRPGPRPGLPRSAHPQLESRLDELGSRAKQSELEQLRARYSFLED